MDTLTPHTPTPSNPSPEPHALTAGTDRRHRIVIIGGGYGGAYCAQALGRLLRGRDDVEVLLIDRHNYFVFYPLLVEAGTGSLEPRHAIVPIRAFLRGRTSFCMAEVIDVDQFQQRVHYQLVGDEDIASVRYDHLVVALGSVSSLPRESDVPGVRQYAYEMKSLSDAVALRDRAIQQLELANALNDPDERTAALHFVVAGGNFTGVEVAGEFDMFLREAAKMYPNVEPDDCKVTLIEMTGRILHALGDELSDFAEKHLRRRGVDVRLNTTINEIESDSVFLSTGERLCASTIIWTAGIKPNPLTAEFDLPTDDRGYIECDRELRVAGCQNIWAIGDGAVNRGPDGAAYPATAQHAVRQGKHCAQNIVAVLEGRQPKPCDLKSQGALAALGCRTGVADVFGMKLSGFAAWWLWRTVYLMKMPGVARKFRVALDWTIDLLFRRDFVQLGVHKTHDRTQSAERQRNGSPSASRTRVMI